MAGFPDISKQIQPIGSISMVYKFTGLPWVLIHMHPSPQHQLWSDPFVVRLMEEEIWIQKTWVIYSHHPLSRLGELLLQTLYSLEGHQ